MRAFYSKHFISIITIKTVHGQPLADYHVVKMTANTLAKGHSNVGLIKSNSHAN